MGQQPYFQTSLEHLLRALEWVDGLIQIQVWRLQQLRTGDERFLGLYITDQEVDELVQRPIGYPAWQGYAPDETISHFNDTLEAFKGELQGAVQNSLERGIALRLVTLAERFGLDDMDVALLLIAIAPEIDPRYEKLYGYLQDDVTRKRPSIDLALNLLSGGGLEKLALRSRVAASGSLIRAGLIQLAKDPHQPQVGDLSQSLQVHPAVVGYLLELTGIDPMQHLGCHWGPVPSAGQDLPLSPPAMTRLQQGLTKFQETGVGCLYLAGPTGLGQREAATAIADGLGLTLLTVNLARAIAAIDQGGFERWWKTLTLLAFQHGALLYVEDLGTVLATDQHLLKQQLGQALANYDRPVVLAGTAAWPYGTAETVAVVVPFDMPDRALRQQVWQAALTASQIALDVEELRALSDRFMLTFEQIRGAVAQVADLLQWGNAEGQSVAALLFAAAREQTADPDLTLAQKLTPRFRWEDMVLLPEQQRLLQALCDQVIYRPQVYGDWGFGRKLVLGKGISALFAGPSGTGKTMAAEVIAHTLQLELYKIDLSQVVNKYIGETEKNLGRIFAVAEQSNAILFFDEADALFGKRSEVKDAHDRYANLEVAYLLQKMEEYEGVTILTTNLRQNLDDAFTRRIRFVVEFPFPEAAQRLQIWQSIWPPETALAPDLTFNAVAQEFKLTGGNIRNVALAAAFLAAAQGQPVGMTQVIQALRQELSKLGRVVSPERFERLLGDTAP